MRHVTIHAGIYSLLTYDRQNRMHRQTGQFHRSVKACRQNSFNKIDTDKLEGLKIMVVTQQSVENIESNIKDNA